MTVALGGLKHTNLLQMCGIDQPLLARRSPGCAPAYTPGSRRSGADSASSYTTGYRPFADVELLVVVQAVAGSSPVAHPHKVAARGVFLASATTTPLEPSYQ